MRTPTLILSVFVPVLLHAQGFPWEHPLMIAWSADGTTFDQPTIFQDSSGVPSVVRWHGDTLIATFQWFRQPNPSPSWDRVAVKFSYDNGATWTGPTPIIVNGLSANYQRPFDPTLAAIGGDSLRIYFSSSDGLPMGLDSTVNTYSAVSADGVNYTFEPGARVDVIDDRVIDPAVIHFGPGWHYLAPAGAPQDGAHHYLSPNGVNFTPVPMIMSDVQHNWTGNYMVDSPAELRFYGAGQNGIWYNSTPNGGQWNGYVNTNLHGGDPTVLKVGEGSYLIVYVGPSTITTGITHAVIPNAAIRIAPLPVHDILQVSWEGHITAAYSILTSTGMMVCSERPSGGSINVDDLPGGIYLLELIDVEGMHGVVRFVKE